MAQDNEIKGIWRDILQEKKHPELLRQRYGRAFYDPNNISVDPYHRYDKYDDDYMRVIERRGKITGSKV